MKATAGHCLQTFDQPVSLCFSGLQVKAIHHVVGNPLPIPTASETTLILNPMKFNSSCWIKLLGVNL